VTTEEHDACEKISKNITLLLNALNSYQIGLHEDDPHDRKVIFQLWDIREALLTIARIKKEANA
jgi:hypothetical protein